MRFCWAGRRIIKRFPLQVLDHLQGWVSMGCPARCFPLTVHSRKFLVALVAKVTGREFYDRGAETKRAKLLASGNGTMLSFAPLVRLPKDAGCRFHLREIYVDFLFGAANRFSSNEIDSLTGQTVGTVCDVVRLKN